MALGKIRSALMRIAGLDFGHPEGNWARLGQPAEGRDKRRFRNAVQRLVSAQGRHDASRNWAF